MFVQHLGIETGGSFQVVSEPKWPQIQQAIENLDGDQWTMVVLEVDAKTHMAIGGGINGWCVLSVAVPEGKFYRLIDPSVAENSQDLIELKVSGCTGVYLREMLIQKADAAKVAKPFAEKGEFETSFEWREQVMREAPTADT